MEGDRDLPASVYYRSNKNTHQLIMWLPLGKAKDMIKDVDSATSTLLYQVRINTNIVVRRQNF